MTFINSHNENPIPSKSLKFFVIIYTFENISLHCNQYIVIYWHHPLSISRYKKNPGQLFFSRPEAAQTHFYPLQIRKSKLISYKWHVLASESIVKQLARMINWLLDNATRTPAFFPYISIWVDVKLINHVKRVFLFIKRCEKKPWEKLRKALTFFMSCVTEFANFPAFSAAVTRNDDFVKVFRFYGCGKMLSCVTGKFLVTSHEQFQTFLFTLSHFAELLKNLLKLEIWRSLA